MYFPAYNSPRPDMMNMNMETPSPVKYDKRKDDKKKQTFKGKRRAMQAST